MEFKACKEDGYSGDTYWINRNIMEFKDGQWRCKSINRTWINRNIMEFKDDYMEYLQSLDPELIET